MPKIVAVVEGDGEVRAVPNLVSRLLSRSERFDVFVDDRSLNAHGKSNLTKPGGVEGFVKQALRRDDVAAVLVVLDADRDCARDLATALAGRIRAAYAPKPVAVVCAKTMFEAWFFASEATIVGEGLPQLEEVGDPESIANPKDRIDERMRPERTYSETRDQLAMTRLIDIDLAHRSSRSFRRLMSAVDQLLHAIDANEPVVTPVPQA